MTQTNTPHAQQNVQQTPGQQTAPPQPLLGISNPNVPLPPPSATNPVVQTAPSTLPSTKSLPATKPPEPRQKDPAIEKLLELVSENAKALTNQEDRTKAGYIERGLRDELNGFGTSWSNRNPVLLVCIIHAKGNAIKRQYTNKELFALIDNYDFYVKLFGEALPTNFREQAKYHISFTAYHDGTNQTAAGDWGFFKNSLSRAATSFQSDSLIGLPSGIKSLDNALGGIHDITFLGGDKGIGKTNFMINAMMVGLETDLDLGVIFYSLDMDKAQLYSRMLCYAAGLEYRTVLLQSAASKENQSLTAANNRLIKNHLRRLRVIERDFSSVEQVGESVQKAGLQPDAVISDCREFRKNTGVRKLLVIFDLFQKIDPPGDIQPSEYDHYRLDLLSRVKLSLNGLGQGNSAILVSSEIRKADIRAGKRYALTRDDLKGDGRIGSDAGNVLLLSPTTESAPDADDVPITLTIDKGRDGVIRGDLKLIHHHRISKFSDASTGTTATSSSPANSPSTPTSTVNPYEE